MVKTSRKNKVSRKNSSKKNKKSKKNGKQYSRKNKIEKMKGGDFAIPIWEKRCSICFGKFLWPEDNKTGVFTNEQKEAFLSIEDTSNNNTIAIAINKNADSVNTDIPQAVSLDSSDVCQLLCRHIFHKKCITLSHKSRPKPSKCPYCREIYDLDEITVVGKENIYDKIYFEKLFSQPSRTIIILKPPKNSLLMNTIYDSIGPKIFNDGSLNERIINNISDALINSREAKAKAINSIYFKNFFIKKENFMKFVIKIFKEKENIYYISIRKCDISVEGAKDFAAALKENKTLKTLDIGDNSIGDEGANALAESLIGNTTLTELDISRITIGVDGANALAKSLIGNTKLTVLNISSNKIGDDGVKALAEALKENKTLTTLDISYNNIGDVGVKALAEALKENKTLTTLNISSNTIGVDGAKALAEGLEINTSLTTLDISSNKIGDDGGQALYSAIYKKKFENLYLSFNGMTNFSLSNYDRRVKQYNA